VENCATPRCAVTSKRLEKVQHEYWRTGKT
jgi:hypothetical protein